MSMQPVNAEATSHELARRVEDLVGQMSPLGGRSARASDRLVEDLGYDSIAIIELAFVIESEFNVPPMKDNVAMGIETVGDITKLLQLGGTR